MNKIVNTIKFAGRLSAEVVVGSAAATTAAAKAASTAFTATSRARAIAFVAAELARDDSPLQRAAIREHADAVA